jgi:tryptophan halogenase
MVKKIIIAGGGSAGWMTASYLATHLEDIEITLIESSDVPVVGVGESTIVPMVNFMKSLGQSEQDWMPHCDATFKSAIRFKNYYSTEEPAFWYSFEPMPNIADRPLNRYWHNKHLVRPEFADRHTFFDFCFATPEICRQMKTTRSIFPEGPAYHLDAGLLGAYLAKLGVQRGVERIIDNISQVNLAEDGSIRSISRENGPDLEGDLYIDCTGFRSLLMDKTIKEPFDNYYDYLFNNKAVAIRYPYEDKEAEMFSYTNCTAVSSGWIWQIPLYGRIGAGYVYCDKFQEPDDAERELKEFLGYERTKDLPVKHIDIRVGKHRRTWVKNCIAVGLSSGFIEPLESTGLFIIQLQAETIGHLLKGRNDYNVADVAIYNKIQDDLYTGVRDFLVCHYALTERTDTAYWRAVKNEMKIPEALADLLRFSRMTIPDLPIIRQIYRPNFGDYSFTDGWQSILVGMNHLPFDFNQFQGSGPFEDAIIRNMRQADAFNAELQRFRTVELPKLPSHYQYLRENIHQGAE